MALIYKITFPDSILASGTFGGAGTSEILADFGSDINLLDLSNFRNYTPPAGIIEIPKSDISSTDLKVSTKLEEVTSKITYDISFVGETARSIVDYIKYIRLPKGTNAYPEPAPRLEYLFNLDKQIKIKIQDDCCPVLVAGKGEPKTVITGYIPLNTVRYCDDEVCTVNCTIYEDGNRVNAIKCIESTVLGLRSNIGILQNAEVHGDIKYQAQTGESTVTKLANQNAKWFDSCIEPQSPGLANLLINLIGIVKLVLLFFVVGLFPFLGAVLITLTIIINIINVIIRAINVIPFINISTIDSPLLNPLDFATDFIDDILGLERVVEGIYGCKYIRGGYRVSSIISAVCSICDFSKDKIKDAYVNFALNNDGVNDIKIPVTYNPFIPNGDLGTALRDKATLDTFNTAYVPAEEAYNRRKGDKIGSNAGGNPNSLKDVAIRAASIETTDNILNRLGSLWNTKWGVVNVPITTNTPNGIQLQLGPIEGRYSFNPLNLVDIEEAIVCYTVAEGNPIGYSTTWQQDSSDQVANKQLRNYNGYVSYFFTELKDRKPKEVKDFKVDFAPVHYIGSLKDDSVYDDLRANRITTTGFTQMEEFFDEGQMINSTEFTSQPKLVGFEVGSTRVLTGRKACRVKNHNQYFTGSYRMSDYVNTRTTIVNTDLLWLFPQNVNDTMYKTGLQSNIPYYTIGYLGETDQISNTTPDATLEILTQDYLDKYGSSEVNYSDAVSRVRGLHPSFLGPFNNLISVVTTPVDGKGYNFAPLMGFSFELENYSCGQEDLLNQCVTEAVIRNDNYGLDEGVGASFKLRFIRLKLGLGVVTELEIDYENKKIEASGYVIPFIQNGVDYSQR